MGEPEPVGTSSLKIVWSLGDHAHFFHPSPVREGTTGGSAVRAQQAGLRQVGWNVLSDGMKIETQLPPSLNVEAGMFAFVLPTLTLKSWFNRWSWFLVLRNGPNSFVKLNSFWPPGVRSISLCVDIQTLCVELQNDQLWFRYVWQTRRPPNHTNLVSIVLPEGMHPKTMKIEINWI